MMNGYFYPPGAYPAGWESGYPQFARTYLIDHHAIAYSISPIIINVTIDFWQTWLQMGWRGVFLSIPWWLDTNHKLPLFAFSFLN